MSFQNPSDNSKLLRTPTFLTLVRAGHNRCNPDEDELELVCKPISDFLETISLNVADQDSSGTISDSKFNKPIIITSISFEHAG